MIFRKSSFLLGCFIGVLSLNVLASGSYTGMLNDPNAGLPLLKAAHQNLFSSLQDKDDLKSMYSLAVEAASGTLDWKQLEILDQKFQQHKRNFGDTLAKNQFKEGVKVFNGGNLVIHKNGKTINIDLTPKDGEALGLSPDSLQTIDAARIASSHVSQALEVMRDWLLDIEDNKSVAQVSLHNKNDKYFKSAQLYFHSSQAVDFLFEDLKAIRVDVVQQLTQLELLSGKALSQKLTPQERMALDTQFHALVNELSRNVYNASFSHLQVFEGGKLNIQGSDGIAKFYDLPELTLKTLGIKDDTLISSDRAMMALSHLSNITDQMSIWLATGVYDLNYNKS